MVDDKITKNQYITIVFSSMLAVGVLSMASGLCKTAYQNGWLVLAFGGVYPLFILYTASLIDRKTNHMNFWDMSTTIYGKTLSYIFLAVFFLYFWVLMATIVSGYTNVLRLSITQFLEPAFIIFPTMILITLISMRGLSIVGRVCEFYFYVTFPLLVVTLSTLPKGDMSNILPIGLDLKQIRDSIPVTFFAFAGCEIGYFIIGKVTNSTKGKSLFLFPTILLVTTYMLNVFMVIYSLGWRLSTIIHYPLLYIIQSIEIPLMSNFLALVIFLWSTIILKNLLTYNCVAANIITRITKIKYKKANVILFFLVCFLTFFMIPEYNSEAFLDVVLPYFVSFTIIWGLVTTILVLIKFRGKKDEDIPKDKLNKV